MQVELPEVVERQLLDLDCSTQRSLKGLGGQLPVPCLKSALEHLPVGMGGARLFFDKTQNVSPLCHVVPSPLLFLASTEQLRLVDKKLDKTIASYLQTEISRHISKV
jgi:hypothetical protein